MKTRNEILTAVADAIKACGPNENWTDPVDSALEALGLQTMPPDRDDDPWVIAQLAEPVEDGRVIVYREGRGDGPDAYEIIQQVGVKR